MNDVQTELLAPELVAEICKQIPKRLAAQTRQTEADSYRALVADLGNVALDDVSGTRGEEHGITRLAQLDG